MSVMTVPKLFILVTVPKKNHESIRTENFESFRTENHDLTGKESFETGNETFETGNETFDAENCAL